MDPSFGIRGGKGAGAPTFRDAFYGSSPLKAAAVDPEESPRSGFPRLGVKPGALAAPQMVETTTSPSSRSLAEWNKPRRSGFPPSPEEVAMVGPLPEG